MRAFSRGRSYYLDVISGARSGACASALRGSLGLLARAYGKAVRRRNRLYDSGQGTRSVNVPIISVGNITVGGTGKTVLVEDVVRHLGSLGRRAAIVSRGYHGGSGDNDEFRVLAENLPEVPHVTGADRYLCALAALRNHRVDVIVLDDGFSHRALSRDLDIVAIDALCPFGYGHLLPRGLLREPPQVLGRADVVLITRSDLIGSEALLSIERRIRQLAPDADIVTAYHHPHRAVDVSTDREADHLTFKGKRAYMFCAIGNPLGFELTLKKLSIDVVGKTLFIDHHRFTPPQLHTIEGDARRLRSDCLLVTQKDRAKLKQIGYNWRLPIYSIDVQMGYLSGQARLHSRITKCIRLSSHRS